VIRIVKTAFYTTKAMKSAAEGRFGDAERWLDRLEAVRKLGSPERGFRALVHLMNEELERAEGEFREVVAATASADSVDDRYVNLFAKARIAALRGHDDLRLTYEAEARRLEASAWAKSWLPLDSR
jgi:uncharacterized protein HemY